MQSRGRSLWERRKTGAGGERGSESEESSAITKMMDVEFWKVDSRIEWAQREKYLHNKQNHN